MHYIKRLQFNLLDHELVPLARVLSIDETNKLKEKYHIHTVDKLPEISRFDPHALALNLRPGQVIQIIRKSNTALEYNYYRVCV